MKTVGHMIFDVFLRKHQKSCVRPFSFVPFLFRIVPNRSVDVFDVFLMFLMYF